MKRDDVIYGTPCWMDLASSDPERAAAFYDQLFGWKTTNTGPDYGNYIIFSKDGASIAGLMQKDEDMASMPDVWTVYFAVRDAALTMEAAQNASGQNAFDPITVGDLGTMGILTDPSGAFVGIWQPNTHRGFQRFGEPGAPAWHELMTWDFDGATRFFREVFDVTLGEEDTGEGGPKYATLNIGEESYAGIMDATGVMPEGVPSYWTVYYGVTDTDVAVRQATELGGSVVVPTRDSPYGRFAVLADPLGATFTVITLPAS